MRLTQLLQDIRSKEEHVRKRWLMAMSGATMILVTTLWVQYIQGAVGSEESVTPEVAAVRTRPSFTAVLSAGMGVIKEKGSDIAGRIREKLSTPRNIVIENPDRNFIVEELDPVSGASVPKP